MKQTAVEFLEKEIIEIMSYLEEDGAYAMQGVKDKLFGEKNIIQQAKEMEKEQINDACYEGYYQEGMYDTRAYYDNKYKK